MQSGDGNESKEMQDRWKSLDEAGDIPPNLKSTKPLIQRVSDILRNNEKLNNERYFTPISVAVGPLHCDIKFHRSEKFKKQLAAKFIKYSGKKTKDFYKNVKEEINSLRKCYDTKEVPKEKWNDEELAWMFLVDGCALLNFIYLDVNKKWKELGGKNDLVAFTKLDLFLLENQLPYQLLKILMETCTRVPSYENEEDSNPASVLKESIIRFVNMNDMSPAPVDLEQPPREQKEPAHLLDLLWRRMTEEKAAKRKKDEKSPPVDLEQPPPEQILTSIHESEEREEPAHLLEPLWRRLTEMMAAKRKQDEKSDGTSRSLKNWHTFRNIKELKEHGILFNASETSSVMDITFRSYYCMATLKLPPIKFDDYTAPKLMNLIAYEMCPDFMNEFEITSYVSFLDSLIDKAEDVKELRDAGVLKNRLGSDKNVARLFNKISINLVPNPKQYNDLKDRIQEHCNTAWRTHVSQLYHTYFSSPWSILVFLGTLLGLSLTAAQTYKSFNDSPSG